MVIPTEIATPRLILRMAQFSDPVPLFADYCGDADCAKYLMRGRHLSIEQTEKFLANWCDAAWRDPGKSFAWVIAENVGNTPIGVFVLMQEGEFLEFHFGISKKYWGWGLVLEAGQAVVNWLIAHKAMRAVQTICDVENVQSWRVLEKLGFRREEGQFQFVVMPELGAEPRRCFVYRMHQSLKQHE
ncbi:GNAT family N-acetyltransferase [Massilia sp. W12]|uniref:GNAT family N-acetyltransferase n=1 Tax=Massilia sp. W12 TaxID=3126507 RepID=UPI0030D3A626